MTSRVEIKDLPLRARKLDEEDLSNIFGGCGKTGKPCSDAPCSCCPKILLLSKRIRTRTPYYGKMLQKISDCWHHVNTDSSFCLGSMEDHTMKEPCISIADLPARPKALNDDDLADIFGGCKQGGQPCTYDGDCCNNKCEDTSSFILIGSSRKRYKYECRPNYGGATG